MILKNKWKLWRGGEQQKAASRPDMAIRGSAFGSAFVAGWLILLSLVGPVSAQGSDNSVVAGDGPLRVLVADEAGLILELVAPDYRATRVVGPDARPYVRLDVPGFASAGLPGRPDLPTHSVLLALPPGARWVLEAEILAEATAALDAPVWPAPAYGAEDVSTAGALADGAPWPPAVETRFALDAAAYATDTFVPDSFVRIEDAGYVRDVRVAHLTVSPLLYRAASQELRVIQHARIRVRFEGAAPLGAARSPQPDLGGFVDLLRQSVINPGQVEAWRSKPPASGVVAASYGPTPFQGQPRYRITLREAGLYRLTYADLATAGVPLAEIDPRRLSIFHGDDELAIEVAGEADGRFDPADEVRFYAERVESIYTDMNTYWLLLGTEAGRRMTQRSVAPPAAPPAAAFPATEFFEENRIYRSNLPVQSGVDRWFWAQMYVIGAARAPTLTLPFTLEHVLPAGQAVFGAEVWGASSDVSIAPDHRLVIYINGAQIGAVTWDGITPVRPQLSFDQTLLQEGPNTLTLYTPGDTGARDNLGRLWESNWLNWFSVTYEKAHRASGDRLDFTPPAGPSEFLLEGWTGPSVLLYDVSDAYSPVRLVDALSGGASGNATLRFADAAPADARYHALAPSAVAAPEAISEAWPADLRNPAEGADYLLIAHGNFLSGVSPLVQLRRDQGLRVRVIDVQHIYDEFNGGLLDPWAIRDFIQYAYFNWPGTPPAYVLLVGDGAYDFMNYEGYDAGTFIPPFLAYADPILGETAADNRFVTVVGEDLMPDLHLGRLPVNTPAELAAMVNKIIAYELNPAPGPWRTKAVFVADNPDQAGPFGAFSDAAAALLPPEVEITKIYLGTPEFPTNQALRAQQATLEAFNAGAVFFNYVGHSSVSNWAAEQLFGVNTLPQVRNGNYYPIMLPMTCLEGSYHNPRFAGVSESVVRLSSGGAVASWAPTGLGVATGHDYLHTAFYRAVFDEGVRGLGLATTAAKLHMFINARFPSGAPRFHDLLDTYVLLGDPATRFALPDADLSLEATGPVGLSGPGDAVTFTARYHNTGGVRVKGAVVTADLPAALTGLVWQSDDPGLALRPGPGLSWRLDEMPPGATGVITITAQIPAAIALEDLPLRATMRIDSPRFEPDLANNVAGPLQIALLPADLLLVQVTDQVGSIAPGEWLTITLNYANLGPAAAAGGTLELPLLAALDDFRFTQSGPSATLLPDVHYAWDLGTLNVGSKGRVTLSGRVPKTLTIDELDWTISGRITAQWPDNDPSNNVAPAEIIRVDVGDLFEPDNTRETARRVSVPVFLQPYSYDPVGDQDWVVFRAQAGVRYLIRTVELATGGDTVLFLWDQAGQLVAKNDDAGPDTRFSQIIWTATADQDYYVMVTSSSPVAGFTYGLEILVFPQVVFLPMVTH